MTRKCWIVTGAGKNFKVYPIPAKKIGVDKVSMKSKDLKKVLLEESHFIVAVEDGKEDGRWEGKSYSVTHLGKDFTLFLEGTDNIDDIKLFYQFDHQANMVDIKEELKPNQEELDNGEKRDVVKVYHKTDIERREQLIKRFGILGMAAKALGFFV